MIVPITIWGSWQSPCQALQAPWAVGNTEQKCPQLELSEGPGKAQQKDYEEIWSGLDAYLYSVLRGKVPNGHP